MAERGHFGQQARFDFFRVEPLERGRPLGVDEGFDGRDSGVESGCDEILALADEETQPLTLPPRAQSSHELEARIRCGRDHANHSSQAPW
jgi:hypothetical protein